MNYTLMRSMMVFLWLLIIANLLTAFPTWISFGLNLIALLCIVVHLIEFLVLRELIDSRSDGKVRSFIMTMLFGLFYWKSPVGEIKTED